MSANISSSASPPSLSEIVLGISFSSFSLLTIICYIPCLIVLITDAEIKQHSCIKMLAHLGVADMVNLVNHFVAGVLLFSGYGYSIPQWLNNLFAQPGNAYSWFLYTPLQPIIALNRFVTICLPDYWKEKLFSPLATKLWLLAAWAWASGWYILYLSNYCGFQWYPTLYTFFFSDDPWSEAAKTVAWWQNIMFINISALFYVFIIVYLRWLRGNNTQTTSFERRELQIVKQAGIPLLYLLCWDQWWHFAPTLYFDYGFRYAFAVGSLLHISNGAVNPVVYLSLNNTVRNKVGQMLSIKALQIEPTVAPKSAARKAQNPEGGSKVAWPAENEA